MHWPREAGQFIARKATEVQILQEGVEKCAVLIAENVKRGKLELSQFKKNEILPSNKDLSDDQLVNLIFLIDAINFNFWTPKGIPKYTVSYNGKTETGYLAMTSAVKRAIDEGKALYDPKCYSRLNVDDLKQIFRSDSESSMPLFEERVKVTAEIGDILNRNFNGTFTTIMNLANGSSMKLVGIVTSNFPCFRDVHTYDGMEVAIFKRAQILAADIAVLYSDRENQPFHDLDELTMFADYRVPQSLVHFGVMSYSDTLMKKLQNDFLFQSGDKEEVEIRGVSIHATELIVEETRKILKQWELPNAHINSMKVDFFLWCYRYENSDSLESVPYHKTRCIFY